MQGLIVEQRHPGVASSVHETECETPDKDPDWQIAVADLPDSINSVILTDRRIVVITPAGLERWANAVIAAQSPDSEDCGLVVWITEAG